MLVTSWGRGPICVVGGQGPQPCLAGDQHAGQNQLRGHEALISAAAKTNSCLAQGPLLFTLILPPPYPVQLN